MDNRDNKVEQSSYTLEVRSKKIFKTLHHIRDALYVMKFCERHNLSSYVNYELLCKFGCVSSQFCVCPHKSSYSNKLSSSETHLGSQTTVSRLPNLQAQQHQHSSATCRDKYYGPDQELKNDPMAVKAGVSAISETLFHPTDPFIRRATLQLAADPSEGSCNLVAAWSERQGRGNSNDSTCLKTSVGGHANFTAKLQSAVNIDSPIEFPPLPTSNSNKKC